MSTFCLTIPYKAEITFLCFIISGTDVPNRSGILTEQCDCFGEQAYKAYCALSQRKKTKLQCKKKNKPKKQTTPKTGFVPALKGWEQSRKMPQKLLYKLLGWVFNHLDFILFECRSQREGRDQAAFYCSSPSLPFLPSIYLGSLFSKPVWKTQCGCILFCKYQLRPGRPEMKAAAVCCRTRRYKHACGHSPASHFALHPPSTSPHTLFFQLIECHLCLCMEQVSLVNSLNKLSLKKKDSDVSLHRCRHHSGECYLHTNTLLFTVCAAGRAVPEGHWSKMEHGLLCCCCCRLMWTFIKFPLGGAESFLVCEALKSGLSKSDSQESRSCF